MKKSDLRPTPATLFFFLLSLALGIALYVRTRPRPPEAPRPAVTAPPRPRLRSPTAPAAQPSPLAQKTSPPAEAPAGLPRVAIVIDDLGNDPAAVARIAAWPFPVGGAVLPALPGSAAAARDLQQAGKQVLLHLPMEPSRSAMKPGPGVVLRSQSAEEIERILESDLGTVPGAVGVSNHMGSAATADGRVMHAVARVLARRGLFFVDSRTTGATVAREAARDERVPAVSRRVFLDDVATEEAILKQLAETIADARAEGSALALGHPYPATLAVLERELPRLAARGIRLVAVGDLVK